MPKVGVLYRVALRGILPICQDGMEGDRHPRRALSPHRVTIDAVY